MEAYLSAKSPKGSGLFRFCCRLIAMLLLALAVVLAMLDITRSIAASAVMVTPMIDTWTAINSTSFEVAKQGIESWLTPVVWDPVLLSILNLPSWLVSGALSMLLFWFGKQPSENFGRFASS